MKENLIKSPINYTGNKFRILPQLNTFFPDDSKVFVDLFCGGATVGFNVNAEKVIMIDGNYRVINLLENLAKNDIDNIIMTIESIIDKYSLSYSYKNSYKFYKENGYVIGNNGLKKYNEEGFYKLREDYNETINKDTFYANMQLYILMIYGFNNDLRFNKYGKFNLPVGKTDFNKNNYNKLIEYNNRAKEIDYEFICSDFRNEKIQKILLDADFVYCDPPYLITDAFYNENNGWSYKEEKDLLELLNKRNFLKKKFALSNVLRKVGKTNELLNNWILQNNLNKNNINYSYRSSSYNKINRNANEEEVLVTNDFAKNKNKQ